MSTSAWRTQLSLTKVRAFAWGNRASEEYASSEACLSLIVHQDGSVYLVVVESNAHNMLVLDFCQFWYLCTFKRWGTTMLSFRAQGAGLFIVFPQSSSLDYFQDCCDRVVNLRISSASAPTLQELADLDIIRVPRIVGGFLAANAATTREAVPALAEMDSARIPYYEECEDAASSQTTDADSDSDTSASSSLIDELVQELVDEDFDELEALDRSWSSFRVGI